MVERSWSLVSGNNDLLRKASYRKAPTKVLDLQTLTLVHAETYERLIDALVSAASTLHGTPELVKRNALMIALGEHGNVFPDLIRQHEKTAA